MSVSNSGLQDTALPLKSTPARANAILGGSLLVVGTTIGAGMLGLPVKTAAVGFGATIALFAVAWIVMLFTALLMLEVSLWFHGDTNFISMAHHTLGPWGRKIAWVVYLLFLNSVMAAYTAGGTGMLATWFQVTLQPGWDSLLMTCGFLLPFACVLFFGTRAVDYCNRLLIIGLLVFFGAMLLTIYAHPGGHLQWRGEPQFLGYAMPLVITSFGFHLLIPSLKSYLHEQKNVLRMAIGAGSLMAFVIYLIWVFTVLSFIPTWGPGGLIAMLTGTGNPPDLIVAALDAQQLGLSYFVGLFSFFALASSLIGVALGLFDFFADGLRIAKTGRGRLKLTGLTFVPPILFTTLYPQGFLRAMSYASILAAILLIVYPALMAWCGRYRKQYKGPYRVAGGKLALLVALVIGVGVIVCELGAHLSLLPIPSPALA